MEETKKNKTPPKKQKQAYTRNNFSIRFSDLEREKLQENADKAGIFLSQLIRARALKQDETLPKKRETLSDISRTLNLLKAIYKAYGSDSETAFELRRVREELLQLKEALKQYM